MIRRLALLLCLLAAWPAAHAAAEPIAAASVRVVDGDTIQLRGEPRLIRLVGFDAPERSHPGCPAEAQRAEAARARLVALLDEGPLDLEPVACSCPPGTRDTPACNHGRLCGVLRTRGRDVGVVLIGEALAVPYRCGPERCPRRNGHWCEADRSR